MSINFNILCKHLDKKIKRVYFNKESNIKYLDVELVTEEITSYMQNCIYIGKASIIKGSIDMLSNSCFILINDDSTKLEDYINDNLKIIEVNQGEDIFEIYDEIRMLFCKKQRYNQFKISLLDKTNVNRSLIKYMAINLFVNIPRN